MVISRRQALRVGIPLVAAVVFSGLVLGLGGLRVSHAQTKTEAEPTKWRGRSPSSRSSPRPGARRSIPS